MMGLLGKYLLAFGFWLPAAAGLAAEPCAGPFRQMLASARHEWLRAADFSAGADAVSRFYQARGYRPVWWSEGSPGINARRMVRALAEADTKGLRREDYDGDRWPDWIAGSTPAGTAACRDWNLDLALSVSALRYLVDLRVGRVDPMHLEIHLDVSRKLGDPAKLLAAFLDARDPQAQLDAMEPPFKRYRALLAALERYRKLAQDPLLALPLRLEQRALHPDDAFDQLDVLAYRLERLGDLAPGAAGTLNDGLYRGAMVDAVKAFQGRHGLDRDGVIGRKTLTQLNLPMSERVGQIRLTLERWRWLPDDLGHRPLVINVPEYRLYAFEPDGKGSYDLVLDMDVIVGQSFPRHQTPVFRAPMRYIVFSPYWNVPYNIFKRELLEKIRQDPAYLAENRFEIVTAHRPGARVVAFDQAALSGLIRGEYKLRQTAGPHNALGSAKFMFPNQHSVYLHGTPAQGLFYKDKRDFSHGCIRVADPPRLAEHVLKQEAGWDRTRVDEVIASAKRTQVNLRESLDVFVLYGTAVADPDGTVRFFDDVYGHDERLARALRAEESAI